MFRPHHPSFLSPLVFITPHSHHFSSHHPSSLLPHFSITPRPHHSSSPSSLVPLLSSFTPRPRQQSPHQRACDSLSTLTKNENNIDMWRNISKECSPISFFLHSAPSFAALLPAPSPREPGVAGGLVRTREMPASSISMHLWKLSFSIIIPHSRILL